MRHKIIFKTSFILAIFLFIVMGATGLHIYTSQQTIVHELEKAHDEYGKKQLNKIQKITIENEDKILNNIVTSLQNTLSNALYDLNNISAKKTITKIMQKENIKAIYMYDVFMNKIFLAGYKDDKNNIIFQKSIPDRFKNMLFKEKALSFNSQKIGILRVYYDNQSILERLEESKINDLKSLQNSSDKIHQDIQKEFYIQVVIFMLSIVLVVFVMIILLSNYVNEPLQKLKDGLSEFFDFLQNKKDNVTQIEIKSDDEFGTMAKSINENIAVSAKLHEEIYELNVNLEQKIVDKTAELVEVNSQIQKSIDFASIIQHTFNHEDEVVGRFFDDYFIILQQRETVGGDIVLFEELNDNECLLMVIDCTSHGIPGAFVSMIVKTLQRQIINEMIKSKRPINTAEILYRFNYEIKYLLGQTTVSSKSNVGFDGQVLYYNKKENIVKCALARNDLIVLKDDKLSRIKGDKQSVGYKDSDLKYEFYEHTFEITDDMIIYVYSDGFTDQLGGEKCMPFGNRKTISLLENIHNETLPRQKEKLISTLREYQGNHDQNDDISFVGLKFKYNSKDIVEDEK